MSAIQYAIRDNAGIIQRGAAIDSDIDGKITLTGGGDVSLNLRRVDVNDYVRAGNDLEVYLADGRRIVIEGFYGNASPSHLFLNEGGVLLEAHITDDGFVTYVEAGEWGKWSNLDALIFPDDPVVVAELGEAMDGAVLEGSGANEVSTQAAGLGLLGAGLTGLGGSAAGVAGILGAIGAGGLLLGGGGTSTGGTGGTGGSGGGTTTDIEPTVDNAGSTISINGSDEPVVIVSGTGAPGAQVVVTMGGVSITTTVDENGDWVCEYSGGNFPADGNYSTVVVVTNPGGSTWQLAGPSWSIDVTAPAVDISVTEGDDIVNADELLDGVQIQGTAEPGTSLIITIEDQTIATVAGADGSWGVTFDAAFFPDGEYSAEVIAVATDLAGNSTTTTSIIQIDTYGSVTLTPGVDGGDMVVNGDDLADGIVLTGTTEIGSTVVVTIDGNDYDATVDGNGGWSVTIPGGVISGGEYDLDVTVTATDAAGNSSSTTSTVAIDTQTSVTLNGGFVGSDGVLNATEWANGVTFTGTAQADATVLVTVGTVTLPAVVAANGTWSVTFASTDIAPGEYPTQVSVTATDAAGNIATTSSTMVVDTVNTVTANTAAMGGDGVVNNTEALHGAQLTGTAQAGSSVVVTLAGVTQTVVAGANGTWTTTWNTTNLPAGETTATVTVTATDPSGNIATTSGTVEIDRIVTDFALGNNASLNDGVLAGNELNRGLTLTGTTEAGSSYVAVDIGGVTRMASVDGAGNWTVTFAAGSIPGGERNTTLTVTTQDAAGNVDTLSQPVRIDTVAGNLTLSPLPIEIDDTINYNEYLDGVVLNGTATPGMIVTVTFGTATLPAIAQPDGTWSVNFPRSSITPGTYDASISASITDAYGNSKTVTDTVHVDTELPLAINAPLAGDGIISGAEAAAGVTFTGTVDADAVVSVKLGMVTQTAQVNTDGTWTVTFDDNQMPADGYTSLTVSATDPAGNTASLTRSIEVDTEVQNFTVNDLTGGDGYVSAAEAAMGLTLTGTVEIGSTVVVDWDGTAYQAQVGTDGNWSLHLDSSAIMSGDYAADVSITATDDVGNVATADTSVLGTIEVDTVAPDPTNITAYDQNISTGALRSIAVDTADADATVEVLNTNGTVSSSGAATWTNPFYADDTYFYFPDAAHGGPAADAELLLTLTDEAGNTTTTLLALEQAGTDVVNLSNAGLAGYNIDTIDLRIAVDGELTIDSDTLENLSVNGNDLVIQGGSDDTIHVDLSNGASFNSTGSVETIDGVDYNVYTLGDDGGRLLIEEDIVNVSII